MVTHQGAFVTFMISLRRIQMFLLTYLLTLLTHRPPYLPNGKAYELQAWYRDGG